MDQASYFWGMEIGLRAAWTILDRANKRRPHATLAIMDALREIDEKAQSVADYMKKKEALPGDSEHASVNAKATEATKCSTD